MCTKACHREKNIWIMCIDAKHKTKKYGTTRKLATAQVVCGILLMTQHESKYNLIQSYDSRSNLHDGRDLKTPTQTALNPTQIQR